MMMAADRHLMATLSAPEGAEFSPRMPFIPLFQEFEVQYG